MPRSRKYATDEERAAAKRAAQAAYVARHYDEVRARSNAPKIAARAVIKIATEAFVRDVPPLISSRARTRLFIALCHRGPLTMFDVGRTIAPSTSLAARHVLPDPLTALGIVVESKSRRGVRGTYYLNPAHPAYRELLAFGKRLAQQWPSPPHPERKVEQAPVSLPDPLPCNFFRREAGNRALLLVAVTGGLSAQQMYTEAGMFASAAEVGVGLQHFLRLGMFAREARPYGVGVGQGQPRRYYLDPDFFAFHELRTLLWALAATVYQDIAGIARSLARLDPAIAAGAEAFERGTAHLHDR